MSDTSGMNGTSAAFAVPARSRSTPVPGTGLAAAVLVLLAVGTTYGLSRGDGLLVINGFVVLDWMVSSTLLFAAPLLWLIGLPWWTTAPAGRFARRAVRAGLVVLWLVLTAWNLLLGVLEAGNRHVLVSPVGPGECRVVLRATFYAMEQPDIAWRAYTLSGRTGWAQPMIGDQGGYRRSDNLADFRSFSAADYRLTWEGTSGELVSTRVGAEVAAWYTGHGEPVPASVATTTPVSCPTRPR